MVLTGSSGVVNLTCRVYFRTNDKNTEPFPGGRQVEVARGFVPRFYGSLSENELADLLPVDRILGS